MSKKKPNKKTGRPTKFRPAFIARAEEITRKGATDQDLASEFDVAVSSINNWKQKHPEFLEALNSGKAVVDDGVERSLLERARGYSHAAVKIFYDSKRKKVVKVPYIERFPPDPTSMIFWLKNRRADKWRDQKDAPVGDTQTLARGVREMVGALFAVQQ